MQLPCSMKYGVHTMMWGRHLTRVQLFRMLIDIAETAKNFGCEEIGIEFAQKIHHLGYDCENTNTDNNLAETLRNVFLGKEFYKVCKCCGYEKEKEFLEKFRGLRFGENGLPKLVFLGFSGRDSLAKRLDFCNKLKDISGGDLVPKYFMIHEWHDEYHGLLKNDKYQELLKKDRDDLKGATLALHPFRFGA